MIKHIVPGIVIIAAVIAGAAYMSRDNAGKGVPLLIFVDAPKSGTAYQRGQMIRLVANSSLVESEPSYAWYSDKNGKLGEGRELEIDSMNLDSGDHHVTVRAGTPSGEEAVADVRLTIMAVVGLSAGNVKVTPQSLDFTYEKGKSGNKLEGVIVIAGSNRWDSFSWTAAVDQPWIQLDASSGSVPRNITVSVDPNNFKTSGEYRGEIKIMAPQSENKESVIPVAVMYRL